MESQVFNVLRDTATAFFDKEEVDTWLNEAQLDLATRLELLRYEWSGTTTDNTVPLSDGTSTPAVVHILSLRLGTIDVSFVDDTTWNDYSDNARDAVVTIARVFNENIELYPTPTVGTAWKLRGVQEPLALTAPQDKPMLPHQFHPKMVNYARYQALLKDGSDRWQAYAAQYAENLPPPPLGFVKLMPEPFIFSFAPGPFDRDPEATHI